MKNAFLRKIGILVESGKKQLLKNGIILLKRLKIQIQKHFQAQMTMSIEDFKLSPDREKHVRDGQVRHLSHTIIHHN